MHTFRESWACSGRCQTPCWGVWYNAVLLLSPTLMGEERSRGWKGLDVSCSPFLSASTLCHHARPGSRARRPYVLIRKGQFVIWATKNGRIRSIKASPVQGWACHRAPKPQASASRSNLPFLAAQQAPFALSVGCLCRATSVKRMVNCGLLQCPRSSRPEGLHQSCVRG